MNGRAPIDSLVVLFKCGMLCTQNLCDVCSIQSHVVLVYFISPRGCSAHHHRRQRLGQDKRSTIWTTSGLHY